MQTSANDQSQYDTLNVVLTPNMNRSGGWSWQDKQPRCLCRTLLAFSQLCPCFQWQIGMFQDGAGGMHGLVEPVHPKWWCPRLDGVSTCSLHIPALGCGSMSWNSPAPPFLHSSGMTGLSHTPNKPGNITHKHTHWTQSSSCFVWQKGDLSDIERDCWC